MGLGGFVLKGKGGTKKAFFPLPPLPLGATQSNVNKRSLNLKG